MTDAKRGAMLLLLGLFTAVLLYPALHEGGHILVTLLLGGRVREVRLGAAASVLLRRTAPWGAGGRGLWRGRAAAGVGDAASTEALSAVVCGAVGEGNLGAGNTAVPYFAYRMQIWRYRGK